MAGSESMAELQECRDCTRGFISILQPLCLGPPPPAALVATPPEWPQNRLANIVHTCPSEFSHGVTWSDMLRVLEKPNSFCSQGCHFWGSNDVSAGAHKVDAWCPCSSAENLGPFERMRLQGLRGPLLSGMCSKISWFSAVTHKVWGAAPRSG